MEAVIKVGGSLSKKPSALRALGVTLNLLAKSHHIAIVPGGGRFADTVRKLDKIFDIPATLSHRMAILAMDQYGLLLSTVISDSDLYNSIQKVEKSAKTGRAAIILPSKLLLKADPFEPSWNVTSDSIAAYIAVKLHSTKAIFVTDVDGIYSANPRIYPLAKLLKTVDPIELHKFEKPTSVDQFLPQFLTSNVIECYVVNGLYPERVKAVLMGKETICTKIVAKI